MRGSCNDTPEHADPALIAGWLAARSIARGLPAPVAIPSGWKVETGGDIERRRYVLAQPSPEIARLLRSIDQPGIYVKLCCDNAVLQAMLPIGWQLDPLSWVMTGPKQSRAILLPSGYTGETLRRDDVIHVRIATVKGTLAASGFAAEAAGVFVYDRIITEPAHRRRGLGSAVMALLGAERSSSLARPVLVATAAGRALYERLGWSVHSPYASAVIARPSS